VATQKPLLCLRMLANHGLVIHPAANVACCDSLSCVFAAPCMAPWLRQIETDCFDAVAQLVIEGSWLIACDWHSR
jgi:hypothetical protein